MMMMMGMCIGFHNKIFNIFFQICHVFLLYDFINFIKKKNQFEENFGRKGTKRKKKRKLKKKIIKIYILRYLT
jgi:hypothetical protein